LSAKGQITFQQLYGGIEGDFSSSIAQSTDGGKVGVLKICNIKICIHHFRNSDKNQLSLCLRSLYLLYF
jgi:hypothetical protein